MDDTFEKNIIALAQINLQLATEIYTQKSNEKYEVYIGKDSLNINIIDKDRNFEPLYKKTPLEETLELLSQLEKKSRYPYLFFYGVGNGILYKTLLKEELNLKRIFVFEPEIELLKIVFTFIDFSQEILEEKISFYNSKSFNFLHAVEIFYNSNELIYSKLFELTPILPYYDHYQENLLSVNAILIKAIQHSVLTLGNSAEDSLIGLRHHLKNASKLFHTPTMDELVAKCKNTEIAVIVSTGPSLTKQLPLLKEIQEYVTILSVDASFPILSECGITPDVVFSLERVAATAKFYEKTPEQFHKEPIFCITSIAHQKLLDSIKSQNIQMNIRPFNYLAYFNTPDWGYLGYGMSAANMAHEAAMLSKFKKIVFIGQDLAFAKSGRTHADKHVFGGDNVRKDIQNIKLEAYGGDGEVESTPIWKAFLNYFEQEVERTQGYIQTYNCTEGGARIQKTIEMPFAEFIEKFVDKTGDKKKKISLSKPKSDLTKKSQQEHEKRVAKMHAYIQRVQKEIEEIFLELMEFLTEIEKLNQEEKQSDIDFEKAKAIIQKIDKIKAYFKDIEFVYVVYDLLKADIVSQELDIAKIDVKLANNSEEQQVKIIEWLYLHKTWLFTLAGGLEAILTVIEEVK